MAGRLAFVEVVALLAHVNTGAAWVLALYFITRDARLFITRRAWRLWASLMATAVVATAIWVARVLPRLAGVGGAWTAAIVAAAFTAAVVAAAATRIHPVLRRAPTATAAATATSSATQISTGRLTSTGVADARHHF